MLSLQNLREKYGARLNFLQYLRLKTVIELAAKSLDCKIFHKNLSDLQLPRLPLLYKLSSAKSKGCRMFYKTLRARELSKDSMANSGRK